MSDAIQERIALNGQSVDTVLTKDNFIERSEIVQEVLTRKAGFIERWSLLLFLLLFILLVAATWFIHYPDTVQASAILTTDNAPKEIMPQQSGKLISLFVKNNQTVKEGEMLGWLESSSDIKEVTDLSGRLEKAVDIIGKGAPAVVSGLFGKRYSHLGELQTSYQEFILAWQLYNDYLVNGYYTRKKYLLQQDIIYLQKIVDQTAAQKNLSLTDNELAQHTFDMYDTLFKEKVLSPDEYRLEKRKLIENKRVLPQVDVSLLSRQLQIADKQKETDLLDHDYRQQQVLFEQALQTLKSAVDDWLRRFTLQAPVSGQVVFIKPLQQQQYITKDVLLGYVNPVAGTYYADIRFAQSNFGKVDTGMRVQLRFEAYPFQEVGYIEGRLDYLSKVSVDSGFMGTVRLNNGLVTNQHIPLLYRNGLKANAVVITRDMRLLDRLYYSIVQWGTVSK